MSKPPASAAHPMQPPPVRPRATAKEAELVAAYHSLASRPIGPDDEPEPPLSARAAALLVAHLIVEKGAEKVAAMTRDEALAWAVSFRAQFGMVWSKIVREDPMGLQYQLEGMGLAHDTVTGYQLATTRLLSPVA